MTPFAEWQVFSQVVGSAAGALTGLQFVVMALISDMPMHSDDETATAEAFATPTIVHFTAVLMLAASLAMPWRDLVTPAWTWAAGGLAGLVYTGVVLRRMVRQTDYKPVAEDWLFHTVLPLAAYGGLTACACYLPVHARGALFGSAGAGLLLLAVGIHNAWDNVQYLVAMKRHRLRAERSGSKAAA